MRVDISGTRIKLNKDSVLRNASRMWYERIMSGKESYTGWATLPLNFDKQLLQEIRRNAEEIKRKCNLFIVVGVGGSYLGAKAVIDALNGSNKGCPEVMFAGYNMSASHLDKVMEKMEEKTACLCVISKSGSTLEPMLTYSILKEKMQEVYGEGHRERIYVITDKEHGRLRAEVQENGYKSFDVPSDIGGRYSVLSAVGLLPIAVAGHDIGEMLNGARAMAINPAWKDNLLDYATARVALQNQGKTVEIFEYFEANLHYFGEWLKQLFGESEGKKGKGAYPSSLCFSTDLHSIGQFLQQGNQIFYETMIRVGRPKHNFVIPESAGYPYAGKNLETINLSAEWGVILAHTKAGIPVITVHVPTLDEFNFGKMIYFFEMSCAISAYNLGVNPFDQPGVEAYKSETKKLMEASYVY